MPTYDFVCLDCNREFELHMTIEEHEKREFKCPKCEGENVEQQIEPFFAITNKKS